MGEMRRASARAQPLTVCQADVADANTKKNKIRIWRMEKNAIMFTRRDDLC